MAEAMKARVASMLQGIDRYNPENLQTLQKYVKIQAMENVYDLEANLAVLKLYQFNHQHYNPNIVELILLKALTNLPHTDFVLCKCLIDAKKLEEANIAPIIDIHNLLETCQFTAFWSYIRDPEKKSIGGPEKKSIGQMIAQINGFEDSIRKFICHVVNITYQNIQKDTLSRFLGNLPDFTLKNWMSKYGWREIENNVIFIGNQEDNIKTKNITEKIDFDSVAAIMSLTR